MALVAAPRAVPNVGRKRKLPPSLLEAPRKKRVPSTASAHSNDDLAEADDDDVEAIEKSAAFLSSTGHKIVFYSEFRTERGEERWLVTVVPELSPDDAVHTLHAFMDAGSDTYAYLDDDALEELISVRVRAVFSTDDIQVAAAA